MCDFYTPDNSSTVITWSDISHILWRSHFHVREELPVRAGSQQLGGETCVLFVNCGWPFIIQNSRFTTRLSWRETHLVSSDSPRSLILVVHAFWNQRGKKNNLVLNWPRNKHWRVASQDEYSYIQGPGRTGGPRSRKRILNFVFWISGDEHYRLNALTYVSLGAQSVVKRALGTAGPLSLLPAPQPRLIDMILWYHHSVYIRELYFVFCQWQTNLSVLEILCSEDKVYRGCRLLCSDDTFIRGGCFVQRWQGYRDCRLLCSDDKFKGTSCFVQRWQIYRGYLFCAVMRRL